MKHFRFFLSLILLVSFSIAAGAQDTLPKEDSIYWINICVKDKTTGETLPFVTILVYVDDLHYASACTDVDGKANVKIIKSKIGKPQQVKMQFRYLGYETLGWEAYYEAGGKMIGGSKKMSAQDSNMLADDHAEDEVDLLDRLFGGSGRTFTSAEYQRMPK